MSISVRTPAPAADVLANLLAQLMALLGKDVTRDQLAAALNEALEELA